MREGGREKEIECVSAWNGNKRNARYKSVKIEIIENAVRVGRESERESSREK